MITAKRYSIVYGGRWFMDSVIHFSTTESGGYLHQQLENMNHDHRVFG